jgi:tetraacyldisaccharide 4'-kinase
MTDLRSYFTAVHAGRRRDSLAPIVTGLLWPLSLLFRLAVLLRNFAYDSGIKGGQNLDCKVVSIGNLTTGGTGKTPVTMLIAERLQQKFNLAILSRSYHSGNERRSLILRGDQIVSSQAPSVGDELLLLAALFPKVWFAIGANRFRGGSQLVPREHIQIAILDDGFQHRQLARNCDIVLVDASNPFGNRLSLPAGPLRENLSALKRAHVVLLTRCESVDRKIVSQLEREIGRHVDFNIIFKLRTNISRIRALESQLDLAIPGRKVWLFSGIGNPDSFERLISAAGLEVLGHTVFADHHSYDSEDIKALGRRIEDGAAACLLTTAKDAVKLPANAFPPRCCGVVEIGIDFVDREDIFWGIIARSVGA